MSSFTCITCHVAFHDADLQRNHYKTDWHRYNLKRKVADMPPVTAENFQERLEAIKAEEESQHQDTSSHCRLCNKHFSTGNSYQNHLKSKKHKEAEHRQQDKTKLTESDDELSKAKILEKNQVNAAMKKELEKEATASSTSCKSDDNVEASMADAVSDDGSWESWDGEALVVEECLFCSHLSKSLEKNIKHMTMTHSFFIPDLEYVCDLEGLIRYLGEKVGEGHICLWCNEKSKTFLSTKAVQQHMVDKGHCKMLHDGDAIFEYADYYDYRSSYPDYIPIDDNGDEVAMEDEEEVQVEDIISDPQDEENYQLVLPSGAVVGHRSLMRYYRQKLRPDRQLVVRNPSSVSRVMAQYKALGWTGTTGQLAQKRAKDLQHFRRLNNKRHMLLGVKANKLQKHFRDQVFGY